MKYRDMCGCSVSVLGLGCMRLPVEQSGKIDEERFTDMVKHAYESGVNYYDTAYMYHDGESEIMLGKVLGKLGIREKVYVADKLPPWNILKAEDTEKIFEEQLKKVGTDYFDFYLLHSMTKNLWDNTIKKLGALDKLIEYKKQGKIKHLGFSFHDDLEAFYDIINEGKGIFEFCQIQLNYADAASEFQAGIKGLEFAAEQGLKVIIMEPIKGGQLASLSEHVGELLPKDKTPVECALSYLWDRPEVTVVRSGMGSMEQLKENIGYAKNAEAGMLTDEERKAIISAGHAFNAGARVQCTGCSYCMPCPKGIDIPKIFKLYNEQALKYSWEDDAADEYKKLSVKADSCVSCRRCTNHCPQNFHIPKLLQDAHSSLN